MSEEKKGENTQVTLIKNYQAVFSTPEGKAVLHDLMVQGHFLKPTTDVREDLSYRNEGKRELVLQILTNINYDLVKVLKFIQDQVESEQ